MSGVLPPQSGTNTPTVPSISRCLGGRRTNAQSQPPKDKSSLFIIKNASVEAVCFPCLGDMLAKKSVHSPEWITCLLDRVAYLSSRTRLPADVNYQYKVL